MQLRKGLNRFFATAALAAGAGGCVVQTDVDVDVNVTIEIDCSSNGRKEVYKGDKVRIIDDQYVVYKQGLEVGRSAPGANCEISPSATAIVNP